MAAQLKRRATGDGRNDKRRLQFGQINASPGGKKKWARLDVATLAVREQGMGLAEVGWQGGGGDGSIVVAGRLGLGEELEREGKSSAWGLGWCRTVERSLADRRVAREITVAGGEGVLRL